MGARKKKNLNLTNEIYARLGQRVEAALQHEDVASLNLPENLSFEGDPEVAFKYWDWLQAIDWQWDLNTVMEQPEALMNDIATLSSTYNTMYRIAKKEKDKWKDRD